MIYNNVQNIIEPYYTISVAYNRFTVYSMLIFSI